MKTPLPDVSPSRARSWLTKRRAEILSAVRDAGSVKGAAENLKCLRTTVYKHLRKSRATIARMDEAMKV